LKQLAPSAVVIRAASQITVDKPDLVKGKRVLVVEDGPTVTHGDMTYGVGLIAAKRFQAAEIVDPRRSAVGIYKDTFKKYSHLTHYSAMLWPCVTYRQRNPSLPRQALGVPGARRLDGRLSQSQEAALSWQHLSLDRKE